MVLKFDVFLSLLDKKDRRWLIYLGLSSAFAGFLEVISISALMFIVVFAMKGDLPANPLTDVIFSFFSIKSQRDAIFLLSLFLIFLFIFKNLFNLLIDWAMARYVRSIERKIGSRLFANYLNCPYGFKVKKKTSDFFNILITEINGFSNNYISALLAIFSTLVTTAFILAWMLYQDFLTFSIIILVICITIWTIHKWTKQMLKRRALQSISANQQISEAVLTPLNGFKETKIYDAKDYFLKQFHQASFTIAKSNAAFSYIAKLPRAFLEMAVVTTVILLMMWAVSNGAVDSFFINISVFAFSLFRLLPLMVQFGTQISSIQRGMVTLEQINQELTNTAAIIQKENKMNDAGLLKLDFNKEIVVKQVSFSYDSPDSSHQKWVLKNINLVIEKNKTYAFVGNSGGGKTTLVDIISGLLHPTEGDVYVDGISIQRCRSLWWKHLGYIPQHIYLTNNTIQSNIAYGIKEQDIDLDKLNKAIQIADLEELVQSLPEKEKTIIGENGMQLSGGQRQRVGIARALYHDPSVLVLDEATASLDNISEFAIMNALQKLSKQKTIIIIAHRLSTVQRADKIFLLSKGEIVDQGTFQHLSENSDMMKQMINPVKTHS